MKHERIEYLDVTKALLIMMMVLGHVYLSGPIRQFIYTFHMPAFLIVSGIQHRYSTTSKKPFLSFLKSRVFSLIVPFIFYETLGVVYHIICFGATQTIFGYIHNTLLQKWNNGAAGFLVHLFGAEIIVYFVLKRIQKTSWLSLIAAALLLLGFAFPENRFSILQCFAIYSAFTLLGYCVLYRQADSVFLLLAAIAITIAVSFFHVYISNGFGDLPTAGIYIVGAIAGSFACINVSKHLHNKFLSWLGKNTIIVLGTHNVLLFPIRAFVFSDTSGWIGLLVFAVIMLLEIPIIHFMNRWLPYLNGKKRRAASPQPSGQDATLSEEIRV